MKQLAAIITFAVLTIFSCEKAEFYSRLDDISPNLDQFRISKILNYSTSTSKSSGSGIEYTYDKKGNLIKETSIVYPGTIETYKTYEYKNNKKSRVNIYAGQVGNLTLVTYIVYSYTQDKLTKEEIYLADGTLKYSTITEYDGDLIINTYKEEDGLAIHHHYKYTFDNIKGLTLEQVYTNDQELSGFTKYFYDKNGRLIKTELYDHNSMLKLYVEYVYHRTNKLPMKELRYNHNGTLTQTREMTYDIWENLTETLLDGSCTLFKRKYNGRLLKEEIRYATNWGCSEWGVTRYEYEKK